MDNDRWEDHRESEGRTSTANLLEDVRDVNLSYLLLMQRLITTDRETAIFRLKIDEDMADLLSTISVQELARLAQCNQLLCHFALGSAQQLFSLIHGSKDDDMRRIHAGILLSAQDKRDSGHEDTQSEIKYRRCDDPGVALRSSTTRRARSRRLADDRAQGLRLQEAAK